MPGEPLKVQSFLFTFYFFISGEFFTFETFLCFLWYPQSLCISGDLKNKNYYLRFSTQLSLPSIHYEAFLGFGTIRRLGGVLTDWKVNNKFCIKCCCGYPDNPFITREALNRLQSENFQKNEQLFKTWTFPIYLMMTVLISLHLIWYLLINTKELCKHISLRRKIWSVIGFLAIPRKYDRWRESFLSLVRRERTGLWLVACRILLVEW